LHRLSKSTAVRIVKQRVISDLISEAFISPAQLLTCFQFNITIKKTTLASAWPVLNNNVLHIFAATFL